MVKAALCVLEVVRGSSAGVEIDVERGEEACMA